MKKVLTILAIGALAASCGKKAATTATDDDGNAVAASSAPLPVTPLAPSSAPVAAPTPAPAPGGAGQGSTLDASDQKLATGQFYEAAPLKAEPGETLYLNIKSSFKPVLVILDANKQKVSESTALTPAADGSWSINYSEEFPQGGQYYAIIAAEQVGATGPYTVEFRRGRKIG